MNKGHKLLAFSVASMMLMAGIFAAMSFGTENEDQENETLGSPNSVTYYIASQTGVVELRPGDTLLVRGNPIHPTTVTQTLNASGASGQGVYTHAGYHVLNNVRVGTHNVTFAPHNSAYNFTIDVFVGVTFKIPTDEGGFIDNFQKSYNTIQLPSLPPRNNYVLQWFTSEGGGSLIGAAGDMIQTSSSFPQTLWGRWVPTAAYFVQDTNRVFVHYLESMEYKVNPKPEHSVLTAHWANPMIQQEFNFSNNVISIDKIVLPSGTHEMIITASSPGISSTSMSLFINVYPHEIRNLDTFGLSYWSYTVTTTNPYDEMDLIMATRTDAGGNTHDVPHSEVIIDDINRIISHVFSEVGLYEFALRLTAPPVDNQPPVTNTLVLRIWVTDEIVSGTPSVDGVTIIQNANGHFDFVLINPSNFLFIIWDFGNGNTETTRLTTQSHRYLDPDIFTLRVTLSNSFNDTVTIERIVTFIDVQTPAVAHREVRYVAVVEVDASHKNEITVDAPDWLYWDFLQGDGTNFVRIFGTFEDPRYVGREYTITVSTLGYTDAKWDIVLRASPTDALRPDFALEWVDGRTIRILYTGSSDGGTDIFVQWRAGAGFSVLFEETWTYHTYSESGTFTISVSAIRDQHHVTASKAITINISGGGPVHGPDEGFSGKTMIAVTLVIMLFLFCIASAYAGRIGTAIFFAVFAAVTAYLGVIS